MDFSDSHIYILLNNSEQGLFVEVRYQVDISTSIRLSYVNDCRQYYSMR